MPALREAAVMSAALAVTGSAVYIIWTLIQNKKKHEQNTKNPNNKQQQQQQQQSAEKQTTNQTPAALTQEQTQVTSGTQVLVLGLEGSGKTSLLHCFATGFLDQDVTPTQGFNAVSINKEELQIEFLEIGGVEKLRDYWQMYLKKARVLVFVVDSAEPARFSLAKTHLHRLLTAEPYLPLVLLANKQDVEGACGVAEVYEALSLGSVGDGRRLCVIGTCVLKGRSETNAGVQDARELIMEMMNNNQS